MITSEEKKISKDENLRRIKKNVDLWRAYFKENNERFNTFKKFVLISSLSRREYDISKSIQRPLLEFNILEAYVSRLLGQFYKNSPDVVVKSKFSNREDTQNEEMASNVEMHMRQIINESDKNGFKYNIWQDILVGGFSAAKVYTQYSGEKSFDENILIKKIFDPTLCGFDPTAKERNKQDGSYCFELFPMRKEEAEEQFGKIFEDMEFVGTFDGFSWSYKNVNEKFIIICDYYEKKKKKTKIVLLSNQTVMTVDEYERFIEGWKESGIIEQAPVIIGKPRYTYLTEIWRYVLCENKIIRKEKTIYTQLPLVFFDGNSCVIKEPSSSTVTQVTRPLIYHAAGAQRLKNLSGQQLCNELENISQGMYLAAKESIPEEYADAYRDPQTANVLIYNAFKDNNPNIPLPPPQIMMRRPIPQEIVATFSGMDSVVQNILGSYDSNMAKLSERDVSGYALERSESMSNASAQPFTVGFLNGLQGCADIIVDLIPKTYTTPRSIPIILPDNKEGYLLINQQGGVKFSFDPGSMEVQVRAGPSFSVQQEKAINEIIGLSKAVPGIADFISQKGLRVILDNIEIRSADQLRKLADEYLNDIQQQKMAAQNNPPQDPNMMFAQVEAKKNEQRAQLEAAKLQQQSKQDVADNQIQIAKLEIENKKLQLELMKTISEINKSSTEEAVMKEKIQDERVKTAVDLAIKANTGKITNKDIKV